jgi:hypothetical protein
MRRITAITGPDGKVTTVVTRSSGCGCLTILAAVVVLFGPAAWFPGPLSVAAYVLLGVLGVVYVLGWYLGFLKNLRRPGTNSPQPPPAPPFRRVLAQSQASVTAR